MMRAPRDLKIQAREVIIDVLEMSTSGVRSSKVDYHDGSAHG
jgi:hypothetical protein